MESKERCQDKKKTRRDLLHGTQVSQQGKLMKGEEKPVHQVSEKEMDNFLLAQTRRLHVAAA